MTKVLDLDMELKDWILAERENDAMVQKLHKHDSFYYMICGIHTLTMRNQMNLTEIMQIEVSVSRCNVC